MIRIEKTKRKTSQNKLDQTQIKAFRLLSIAIVKKTEAFTQLLKKFGLQVAHNADKEYLIDAVLYLLEEQNKEFKQALIKLLTSVANQNKQEDHFSGAAVSSVAGAVGSIFNTAGSLINSKAKKREARQQSLMALLQMEQLTEQRKHEQQVLQAQERIAARQQAKPPLATTETSNKNNNAILWVGVVTLVLGGLYVWKRQAINALFTKHLKQ